MATHPPTQPRLPSGLIAGGLGFDVVGPGSVVQLPGSGLQDLPHLLGTVCLPNGIGVRGGIGRGRQEGEAEVCLQGDLPVKLRLNKVSCECSGSLIRGVVGCRKHAL